jgi:hypothetical protein
MSYRFCFSLIFVLSVAACKKENSTPVTCKTPLFAYSGTIDRSNGNFRLSSFGIINRLTATDSRITTLSNTVYANQGAYNSTDHCFYLFNYDNGTGSYTTLTKIDLEGTVTTLKPAGLLDNTEGLFYNRFSGKLCCILAKWNGGSSFSGSIAEVQITGSIFITAKIANMVNVPLSTIPVSPSVDNETGDIYYLTHKVKKAYSIEKFHPGDSIPTVVMTGNNDTLLGLRFNPADKMLYALRRPVDTSVKNYEFIRITAAGAVTTLNKINTPVSRKYFSACIDPCNNRYIFSVTNDSTKGTISQLGMDGTVLQHDTTTNIFLGLEMPQ